MSAATTRDTTSLPDWVDQLLRDVFFQPHDDAAIKAYGDGFSPEFTARVNTHKFTHGQFLEVVKGARARDTFTLQSNEEILTWNAPDGSGAGSVTQLGRFTSINKETGKETKTSSVTLATVGVVDGKRVLLELAETSKED